MHAESQGGIAHESRVMRCGTVCRVGAGAYPAPEPGEEACCWLCTSSTARRMLVAVRRLRWLAAMASLCSCVSSRPDSADATLADVSCTHPACSPSAQGLAATKEARTGKYLVLSGDHTSTGPKCLAGQ